MPDRILTSGVQVLAEQRDEHGRDRIQRCTLPRGGLLATLLGLAIFSPLGPQARGDDAVSGQTFELRVVGPEGQPVAGAEVQIRNQSGFQAENVLEGEFLRAGRYGAFCRTTEQGTLKLRLVQNSTSLTVSILTPGFGPYWAQWEGAVPERFTAELGAAWTVGGVVVDDQGKPVAGARVSPSLEWKKRPGNDFQLGVGKEVVTDEEGRWSYPHVPISLPAVSVSVSHGEFVPLWQSLSRSDFEVTPDTPPAHVLRMDRGLTITGRVADEEGRPIAGALVRTRFRNDRRETKTDSEGSFSLSGCLPGSTRLVVSASGKALARRDVVVSENMPPVDFALSPGGRVRIRVVDHEGKPSPKARIFFQQWGGDRIQYFEFDHVNQTADEAGVWEWNEAPLEGFHADICPVGGMQIPEVPFLPREEEYVVTLLPPLIFSGRVIDAETGKPIPEFRVIPGVASGGRMHWDRRSAREASNGWYEYRPNRAYDGHAVRIEAAGYRSMVSREVGCDEGTVTIDFQLAKATEVFAKIVTPEFKPARGAKIALAFADTQVILTNGDLDDRQSNCPRAVADAEGTFRLPHPGSEFELLVTHPEGFARLSSENEETRKTIILSPWARISGTYRVGDQPVAGIRMRLDTDAWRSFDGTRPSVYASYSATTDAQGRFEFSRVLPGEATVLRDIVFMVREGARETASARRHTVTVEAGESAELDVGGTGRPLIVRLLPPADFQGAFNWRLASISLIDAGGRASHFASVDPEGLLRIDDVDPGTYRLNLHMIETQPGRLDREIVIPPEETREPLDLGDVRLE